MRAVLPSFYDEHAFLRVLDVRSGAEPGGVARGIVFRSLTGTLEGAVVAPRKDHIEITARLGAQTLVAWDGSTILDMIRPPRTALGPDILRVTTLPDGETVWAMGLEGGDSGRPLTRVIDKKTGRIRRTGAGQMAYGTFITPRGVEIWGIGHNTFVPVDLDAVPFGTMVTLPGRLLAFRPAFEGGGVLALCAERELDVPLRPILRRFDASGATLAEVPLDGVTSTIFAELITVPGGCVVRSVGKRAMTRLVAVRDRGTRLEIAWECDVPDTAVLADSTALGAWLVVLGRPITTHRLALEAPPSLPDRPAEIDDDVGPSGGVFLSHQPTRGPVAEFGAQARLEIGQLDDAELDARVDARLAREGGVDAIWADGLALLRRRPALSHRLLAAAVERAPHRAAIAHDFGQLCVLTQRFAEAVEVLTRGSAVAPTEGALRVLLAAAYYGLGQIEDARRTIDDLLETLPPNDPERPACETFGRFLEAAYGPAAAATLAGRRVRTLSEALRLHEAGDRHAAIDVVDVAWVWRPRERTALAVLAELWSALEPATPAEAVRRRLVLGAHQAYDSEDVVPLTLPGRPHRKPVVAPVLDELADLDAFAEKPSSVTSLPQ